MKTQIINFIVSLGAKLLGPVLFFFVGRKSKDAERDSNDAKVLQKQRDNDVADLTVARKRMRDLRRNRY